MTAPVLLAALAVGGAAGAGSASPPPSPPVATVERARVLMGTLCTASAEHADSARALAAVNAALDEIARLEGVMSSWREDSELARLNRSAANGPVRCSEDLAAVLDSSLALAWRTGGAFDPTVGPLIDAWDLRGPGRVPDEATLLAARGRVAWSALELEHGKRTVRFARAGMAVDLGGIGKGYALDRAAATLARHGVRRGLLNLGGEIVALGEGHVVTVAHPVERLTPMVVLEVGDACVSTSGQSVRGFTARGVRYGHVLDPRSGRPVPAGPSITVVCRSATRADALATALLVMGREGAAAFDFAREEAGALWLEPEGSGVRAWSWNLAPVRRAPGAAVRWMNPNEWAARTPGKGTHR